eukprot:1868070-Pyramimonas_sp.AAC.1
MEQPAQGLPGLTPGQAVRAVRKSFRASNCAEPGWATLKTSLLEVKLGEISGGAINFVQSLVAGLSAGASMSRGVQKARAHADPIDTNRFLSRARRYKEAGA